MKVIKPFAPTIGITKLTETTVSKLNNFSEKVVSSNNLTKKYDFDSQLIGSMKYRLVTRNITSINNRFLLIFIKMVWYPEKKLPLIGILLRKQY